MGYSISIPLNKEAPIAIILDLIKKFPYDNPSLYFSSNNEEHGYSVPQENAIYCSFSTMQREELFYLHYFIQKISIKHGLKHLINNKPYSFYYYDDELIYIINESDKDHFIDNKLQFSFIYNKISDFDSKRTKMARLFLRKVKKILSENISVLDNKLIHLDLVDPNIVFLDRKC